MVEGGGEIQYPLMQMQKLGKPRHSHVLGPLKRLLLLRIARIASNSEAMRRARKILVVVFEVQARNHAVGVLSQLGRPLRIVLRGDDLDGHGDGVDVLLCCERGVRGGDAVDEVFALIWPRVSHVSVQHSVGWILGAISGVVRIHIPLAPSWNAAHPPQQKPITPSFLKPCSCFKDLMQVSISGNRSSLELRPMNAGRSNLPLPSTSGGTTSPPKLARLIHKP